MGNGNRQTVIIFPSETSREVALRIGAYKKRTPEKQSVRERLSQLQAEGKQKPNRRKSFVRAR